MTDSTYQNTAARTQMVDPRQGPDPIFHELCARLPQGAEIFEFGVGKWRNALPLFQAGYNVTVQDFNELYITQLREIVQELPTPEAGKLIIEDPSSAVTHTLGQQYDAFLCIRLLHFLGNIENAWAVVRKMQEHTQPGGFNAINFFTAQTIHKPEFFFPTVEEMIEAYAGWEICYQPEVRVSEASATTSNRPMYQQSILFQKKI